MFDHVGSILRLPWRQAEVVAKTQLVEVSIEASALCGNILKALEKIPANGTCPSHLTSFSAQPLSRSFQVLELTAKTGDYW